MPAKAPQWFKQWSEEEFKPLKYKVDLIMSCPTIKKELGLMKSPNQRYARTKRAR